MKWLQWNSKKRDKENPFLNSDGNIDDYDGFSDYMDESQKEMQKLPIDLRNEIENKARLLFERMQIEATGRRF